MKHGWNRLIALLLMLALLLSAAPLTTLAVGGQTEEDKAPQPILYLDMEDISDGSVTNLMDEQTFTIEGNATETVTSPNGTKALVLDGSTNYINVGKKYQVKEAFTAAAWINVSSETADHAKLFGTGRTGQVEPTFSISARRNGWNNICYDFSSFGSAWTEYNTMTFDTWQHLAVVGDSEGITIYLNGRQLYTKAWEVEPLEIPDYVTDMLIGAGWNTEGTAPFANHMFKGALDEVRLYDVALTAEQVEALAVRLSEEKQITAFAVGGQLGQSQIDQDRRTITVTVPDTMDVTALAPQITVSDKAKVEPASGTAQNFTKPVTYTVTAEDGTQQTYTVTVNKVEAEDDPYLKQDGTPAYGVRSAVIGKENWLETTVEMPVTISEDNEAKTLTMENGAIRRVFSIDPENFYTKSYENVYIGKELVTGESLPEVYLGLYAKPYDDVYSGQTIKEAPAYYYVGGTEENTFQLESYEIFYECEKPFEWKPRSKSYSDPAAGDWPPPGKRVEFTFTAPDSFPDAYQGIEIKVIYEMYDNCAAMKKRVEITNTQDNMVLVSRLAPDVLNGNENMAELMYTETNYTSGWDCTTPMDDSAQEDKYDALHCLCSQESEDSPFRKLEGIKHTCYDLGPAYELSSAPSVAPHQTFASFDTYELVYSTYWFEHQSLERLGFYRKVFPWITDNPLTMHNTAALSKEIIDHAAAAGFEMIIQSFGSPDISGQMLSRDPEIIAQYKELVDYAHSKGIEVGTYQAQYTLSYGNDTSYGGNEGAVGGGWSAWCMASAAFDDYWDNFKYFVKETGLDCVEIDGCFAGDACISGDKHVNADRETDPDPEGSDTEIGNASKYAFHHGYFDSKVMQWENAVRMLCKEFRDMDVYIKVPAWYYASGGNKCGIGYDESHWSQAREHQLAYGRKLMYNASYIRTMSMSWAHIPFANYHGGGGNAAFRPFEDNMFDYNWVVAQYLGNGVAADFRGPEIYDDAVKSILDHWVNVYQRYRGIINSDMVHITQADCDKDTNYLRNSKMDTLFHVNANNGGEDGEKGLLWVYNQTDERRTETITVPMYYTGLTSMDYPSYPLPDSMGKVVDHWYGNYTNYEWLPTDIVDQPLPAGTATTDTADFVQDGVTVETYTIDSNGNVLLEVTLEPMTFTYFAIYDGGHAPKVSVDVGRVNDVEVDGEAEPAGVSLTWNADVSLTVRENGVEVEHPVQTVTGYNIYRDGEKIGTSLTNTYVDTSAKENATYNYQVSAMVGADEGARSEALQVTVKADTVAPELVTAKAATETQIVLTFSEPMDESAAENAGNYALDGGKQVQTAVLSDDGCTVTLTVDALVMLENYTLTVRNLTDASAAKNPLGQQTRPIIYGYLAYFPLDGVENKRLENTADGTLVPANGVTFTSGTGKDGCVYFNAEDKDYAELGSGLFNNCTSYTISVAVWPNDLEETGTQAILSAGQPGADKAHNDLGLYLEAGKIRFRTSGPLGSDAEVVLQAQESLTPDTWNQIVVTRDNDVFSLYLNGKLQATVTKEGMPAYASENVIYLGAQKNNAGGDRTSFFGGRMDELVVFSAAMRADQVAQRYAEYQSFSGTQPLIYLDFEDIADGEITNQADGKEFKITGTHDQQEASNGTQAMTFTGSNYINMGSDYQLGGEFTVSAWINVATTNDNQNHKIFGRGWTGDANGEFYVAIRNGGYNIDSSNVDGSGKAKLLDFDTPYFPIQEWAHYAVTCDGTTVKVYKNGVLHETQGTAQNLDLSGNTKELLVGGGWNGSGTDILTSHMFKGAMDEVRLYDMALSQDAIVQLMNGEETPEEVKVTGVELDKSKATLKVGDKLELTATVKPTNATNQKVTWSISKPGVVEMEQPGVFTAVAAGETIITVTTVDGKFTDTCTVTVAEKQETDKTELAAKIDEADKLQASDYTTDSWNAFEAALTAAKGVYNSAEATQEQVNAAVQALANAMENLEQVTPEPEVDKDALERAIWKAERLDEDDYTAASWKRFEKALDAAKAVYRSEDAAQEEVDTAVRALTDAMEALDKKHDRPIWVPSVPDTKPSWELPFTDVPEGAWYYESVYYAWDADLINGVTADQYQPDGSLTVAQAIKLAAALHEKLSRGYVTLENGAVNWYDTYVDYAVGNDIIEAKYQSYTKAQMDAAITRNEFVHIFHGAMDGYKAVNDVADNAIPDVKLTDVYADEIYDFYRAGILTGSDGAGTFNGKSTIKRSEVATILVRMYDESLRQPIKLP